MLLTSSRASLLLLFESVCFLKYPVRIQLLSRLAMSVNMAPGRGEAAASLHEQCCRQGHCTRCHAARGRTSCMLQRCSSGARHTAGCTAPAVKQADNKKMGAGYGWTDSRNLSRGACAKAGKGGRCEQPSFLHHTQEYRFVR